MNLQSLGLTPVSVEGEWAAIRYARNRLLAECDWTQLPDVALTLEERQAWAIYRQALRDITEVFISPEDVEFPTLPGVL